MSDNGLVSESFEQFCARIDSATQQMINGDSRAWEELYKAKLSRPPWRSA